MNVSDFASLRGFAAIVEHRSFSRAARELRVSASALSQTIRLLEDRFGARLLDRTTRSVAPTVVGQRLYDRMRPAIDELEAAVAQVKSSGNEVYGQLRISLPRSAVLGVVAPAIGSLLRAHPNIVLDLSVSEELIDIVEQEFDAGIRLHDSVRNNMVSMPVSGEIELFAVASPEYVKAYGIPQVPADLVNHKCVTWRWPSGGTIFQWPFEIDNKRVDIEVSGPLLAYDFDLQIEAALQGVGLAYTYNARIPELLKAGRLVRVLQPWSLRMSGFHIYYPDRRYPRPILQAFIDTLIARYQSET